MGCKSTDWFLYVIIFVHLYSTHINQVKMLQIRCLFEVAIERYSTKTFDLQTPDLQYFFLHLCSNSLRNMLEENYL